MKISKIASIALISSVAFLVGCGGGSGSSSSTQTKKTVTIKAADAYVVALPSPATLDVGNQEFTTKDVKNGTITFLVPSNVNLDNVEFNVPGNAIVDTDGDGKLSPKDQVIRMPLKTMKVGSVANPIATAALARNDMKAYNVAENFDPVQTKKDLILNPNDTKKKALVAVSDGIAFLAAEAKKKGKNPLEVVKAVNTDVVDQLVSNSNVTTTEDITQVVQQVVAPAAQVADVDPTQVAQKVETVVNVIEKAAEVVKTAKEKGVKDVDKLADQLAVTVVAASDSPDTEQVAQVITQHLDQIKQQIQTAQDPNQVLQAVSSVTQVVDQVLPENSEVVQIIHQNNANNAAENAQNNANNAAENAQNNANNGYNSGNNSNNNIQGNLINGLLKVDTLTIGDKYKVTYNSANHTFNTLTLPADGNYSQYFNVTLNAVCAKAGTFTGNVELNVSKANGSYVDIFIPETITCKSAGEKPVTTISKGTKVGIMTNVANVVNALGGKQVQPQIDKNLINNDLEVNLQQLESAVTKNENKIQDLENTLSDYLQKDSSYNVTIEIKDNNGNTVNTINGKIQIGNGGLVNTTVSFNPNLKYFAVDGTLHVVEGSYNGETVKVKVDQPAPSSTSQNIPIYYNNTQVASISNKYPVGTEIQLGFYKNNSLEKVSGIYILKQSDIDNGYIIIK